VEHTASVEPAPPSLGLINRLVGVVFTPRRAYGDVARRPRVIGALFAVALLCAVCVGTFAATQVGQDALLEQQQTQMKAFGVNLNEARLQQMEARLKFAPYFGALGQFVFLPVMALIIGGIAFAVFSAALGGDATFKQVYAVVVHSGVIIAIQQLFTLPLDYARASMSSPTNLLVFLPFLDEDTFVARMLGSIDLFVIWWAISLAIGLGVLYRKKTGPIATTLLVIYVVIGLIIAGVKTALAGAS
jgi:Yip1-like protein